MHFSFQNDWKSPCVTMISSDEHDSRRMYSPEGFSEWVFYKEGLMNKETPPPISEMCSSGVDGDSGR